MTPAFIPFLENAAGYRVIRPAKCCANCAFSSFSEKDGIACECARFGYAIGGPGGTLMSPERPVCETCGVCDAWCSRDAAILARTSASFEEFNVRKAVAGITEKTPELDEGLSERKSSAAMTALANDMIWKFAEQPEPVEFPVMAVADDITEDGRITCLRGSDSFHSVHHWISENKQRYDDLKKHSWHNWSQPRVSPVFSESML